MNLKTRLWVLATAAFCVAIVLLGFMAGALPQLSNAASTYSIAQQQDESNELQRLQLAQLESAQSNLGELNKQLEQLQLSIPVTIDTSAMLAELDELQNLSGATVELVEVSDPIAPEAPAAQPANGQDSNGAAPAPEAANRVPFMLLLTGSQTQVSDFMNRLQASERLITVERLGFGSSSGESYSARVYASIYTFKS